MNNLGTPHPVGVFVYFLIHVQKKQSSSSAHYMKNVILIKHSPLHKKAKAISCSPCCLKQWILTNQQSWMLMRMCQSPWLFPILTCSLSMMSHLRWLILCSRDREMPSECSDRISQTLSFNIFPFRSLEKSRHSIWNTFMRWYSCLTFGVASWALTSQFICCSVHFCIDLNSCITDYSSYFLTCIFILPSSGWHWKSWIEHSLLPDRVFSLYDS